MHAERGCDAELPPRRPTTAHSSETRCVGGARLPATDANVARSASVSSRAKAALRTAIQVDQLAASPSSAAPSRLRSSSTRSIGSVTGG